MAEVRIPICLVCGSDLPRGGGQCVPCARLAARRAAARGLPADTTLPAAPPLPRHPLHPRLVPVRPRATGPVDDHRTPRRLALAVGVPVIAVLGLGWTMRGASDLGDQVARARGAAAAAAGQVRATGVRADVDATPVADAEVVATQPYATGTGRPPVATVPQVPAGPTPEVVLDTTIAPAGVDPLAAPPVDSAVPGTDERRRRDPDRPGGPGSADAAADGASAEPASEVGSAGPWPPPDAAPDAPDAPDDAPATATTDAPTTSAPSTTVRAAPTPTSTTAAPAPPTTRPPTTTTSSTTTTEPPPPTTTEPPPPPTTDAPPAPTDPPPDPAP